MLRPEARGPNLRHKLEVRRMKKVLARGSRKKVGQTLNQCISSVSESSGWAVGRTEKALHSGVSLLKKGIKLPTGKCRKKTGTLTSSKERGEPSEVRNRLLSTLQTNPSGMTIVELAQKLGVPWQRLSRPLINLIEERLVVRTDKGYRVARNEC
jgi:hypothetical protein